jgi:hypothetical protein
MFKFGKEPHFKSTRTFPCLFESSIVNRLVQPTRSAAYIRLLVPDINPSCLHNTTEAETVQDLPDLAPEQKDLVLQLRPNEACHWAQNRYTKMTKKATDPRLPYTLIYKSAWILRPWTIERSEVDGRAL